MSQRPRIERRSRTNGILTCANCRLRKTRCDGTQPSCKTCEVYHDSCRYDKLPPLSQVMAMAKRLQEAEQAVAELRKALDERSSASSPPIIVPQYTDSLDVRHVETPILVPPIPHLSPHELSQRYAAPTPATRGERNTPPENNHQEKLPPDLSLDENGKICYFGPTSSVHKPPTLSAGPEHSPSFIEQSSKSDVRSLLTSSALESKAWEHFALDNAAIQSGIPRHMITRLLHVHWSWIAPMFMWVYRPAFMRDMTIDGPYYSPFLLTVMCAHAARFDQHSASEIFLSRARLLLGTEIHRPCSIPTVQALLQLSARDLAHGSISQAWLYSGMAFRMVSDLGLHHSTGKIAKFGHLTAEDLEIRRRLFWSCFFWDKAISLYLGRMPVLHDLPLDHTPELLDDSAENDIWAPVNLAKISTSEYPPMKSHVISCFENLCKLAVILNDIILQLYSRKGITDVEERTLRDIKQRLDDWRQNSPDHLKYEPDTLPKICPPPHIVNQNILYYTTIILLHRPFHAMPTHHLACRNAAASLVKLLLLLEGTFGFTRITYLVVYCIYTGASIMVQDVLAGDIEASIEMQTFLRALKQVTTTCPLAQRSIDIITNGLRSDTARNFANRAEEGGGGYMAPNYLPAFPYRHGDVDYTGSTVVEGIDLDGFRLLDCFPENNFENSDMVGGWYFGN
ncbi:hypothetical protein GQ53DRAFT_738654 [Thozetella sp. PMI_491]|nr:hypothetical protein GQ53DRAFT_738654 [Thozetella sp. PMI_491]